MSIETLVAEVSHLRNDFDKHEKSDAQNFKYANHMLEDLLLKHERFDSSLRLFREERVNNAAVEHTARETIEKMDKRLQTVERLAWTAAGGVGVIAAVFFFVAAHLINIVRLLGAA